MAEKKFIMQSEGFFDESLGCADEGRIDINLSSILTKLIRVAGTECAYYASDLFISWRSFLGKLQNLEDSEEGSKCEEWFGFRDSGVDHKAFIDIKLSDPHMYGMDPYSSVYICEGVRNGSELYVNFYQMV